MGTDQVRKKQKEDSEGDFEKKNGGDGEAEANFSTN